MTFNPHTLDLQDAEAPEHVARILRNAAQAYVESQSDLQTAWQDKSAGHEWPRIARSLETLANRIDKMLGGAP